MGKPEVILEDTVLHSNSFDALQKIHQFCRKNFPKDGKTTAPYEGSWLKYQSDLRDLSRSQRLKVWEFCEDQFDFGDA